MLAPHPLPCGATSTGRVLRNLPRVPGHFINTVRLHVIVSTPPHAEQVTRGQELPSGWREAGSAWGCVRGRRSRSPALQSQGGSVCPLTAGALRHEVRVSHVCPRGSGPQEAMVCGWVYKQVQKKQQEKSHGFPGTEKWKAPQVPV